MVGAGPSFASSMVFIIQIYSTSHLLKIPLLPMIFLQVEVSKNIPFLSAIVKLQGVCSPDGYADIYQLLIGRSAKSPPPPGVETRDIHQYP